MKKDPFTGAEESKISIIFLASSMQIGGQEQYIAQQIVNLDRERFHPILCCLKTEGPMVERVKAADIEVFSEFQRSKYDIWSLWRLSRFLLSRRPDILYIFDFRNVLFIGRLAAKLARTPIVVIASHKMNFRNSGRSYGWRLDRLLMSFTDHVIAAANVHRRSLIENDGIKPNMVTAIHNGIQLSRLDEDLKSVITKKDLDIPEDSKIVGTVARLSPEKSQDILLDAAFMVIREVPNTHFVFVGDGPERLKLEAKAASMELGEHIHFLGFRTKVASIVKLFNVFTLSSTSTELFSAATLEAMALGVPVVVTDIGSMSEMIVPGVTGYLVPPRQANELADKILELLLCPQKARQMGDQARKHVADNFTAEREIRQVESLFESLLERKSWIH